MKNNRILFSFPHRIGGSRICSLAWYQVAGLAAQGASVTLFADSVAKPFPPEVRVHRTLSLGKFRIPRRFLGRWFACQWHDIVTAAWLRRNHRKIDSVHCWPLGSLRTLKAAKELGIPTFLERPNTHTAFAYDVVSHENNRLGISLPADHDHAANGTVLAHEEKEYDLADYLVCPSEFVIQTFRDRGFPEEKLLRHQYGYDPLRHPLGTQDTNAPLVVVFAGVCEPRKGLHFALEAWLRSGVQNRGKFLICGEFVPAYRERIAGLLDHPSVEYLGQRNDLGEIMKTAHIFTLPSIEEGSAVVTYEARGAGAVLLVSTAVGAVCEDGVDAILHDPGDTDTLADQFAELDRDRHKLASLRKNSVAGRDALTWEAAGSVLNDLHDKHTRARRQSAPDALFPAPVASAA